MNTKNLGRLVVFSCCKESRSIIDSVSTFDLNSQQGIAACHGALEACIDVIGALFAMGGKLRGHGSEELNRYPSRDLLMIAHATANAKKPDEAQSWNRLILASAESIRSQMVVTIDQPKATQEKPAVIQVEVVGMPKPELMPVEVVSFPARETITTVTRDGQGNIASSVQLERDIEPINAERI